MNVRRFWFIGLMVLALAACSGTVPTTPRSWVDYPDPGEAFQVGESVTILSHHYAPAGLESATLFVNGTVYRNDAFPSPGQTFASIKQEWVPTAPGTYALEVQLTDGQGKAGISASVTVKVRGPVTSTPTRVPPPVPTTPASPIPTTITPPTLTPTPTSSPTPTPTMTPTPTSTPTATPDASPPPPPQPFAPHDGSSFACRTSQTLIWLTVQDPSGIAGYYVKLEMETQPGQWQSAGGYGPIHDHQVAVDVQCGVRYRWMVRAQDGAGNFSPWSEPWYFTVQLP